VDITSMTPMLHSALLSALIAKETYHNILVALGDLHVTAMDEQILDEEVSFGMAIRS
jgi:hypothetical protein